MAGLGLFFFSFFWASRSIQTFLGRFLFGGFWTGFHMYKYLFDLAFLKMISSSQGQTKAVVFTASAPAGKVPREHNPSRGSPTRNLSTPLAQATSSPPPPSSQPLSSPPPHPPPAP